MPNQPQLENLLDCLVPLIKQLMDVQKVIVDDPLLFSNDEIIGAMMSPSLKLLDENRDAINKSQVPNGWKHIERPIRFGIHVYTSAYEAVIGVLQDLTRQLPKPGAPFPWRRRLEGKPIIAPLGKIANKLWEETQDLEIVAKLEIEKNLHDSAPLAEPLTHTELVEELLRIANNLEVTGGYQVKRFGEHGDEIHNQKRIAVQGVGRLLQLAAASGLLDAEAVKIAATYPGDSVSWYAYLGNQQRHFCGAADLPLANLAKAVEAIRAIGRAILDKAKFATAPIDAEPKPAVQITMEQIREERKNLVNRFLADPKIRRLIQRPSIPAAQHAEVEQAVENFIGNNIHTAKGRLDFVSDLRCRHGYLHQWTKEQLQRIVDVTNNLKPPVDIKPTLTIQAEMPKPERQGQRGRRYTTKQKAELKAKITALLGENLSMTNSAMAKNLVLPLSTFKSLKLNAVANRVRQTFVRDPDSSQRRGVVNENGS